VIRCLGYNPTQQELGKALNNVNLEDLTNRLITIEQFCPVVSEIAKNEQPTDEAEFVEGLRVFDRECSGTISGAELRYALSSLGDCMSDAEIDRLIADFEDGNGCVNYSDFVKRICENPHSKL
jgi:Ca2+-binding EF-hand superfamily protein